MRLGDIMALDRCGQLLYNFLRQNNIEISETRVAEIRAEVQAEADRLLKTLGKKLDDTIDGNPNVTHGDLVLNRVFNTHLKDIVDNTNRQLRTRETVEERMIDMDRNTLYLVAEKTGKTFEQVENATRGMDDQAYADYIKKTLGKKATKAALDTKSFKALIFTTLDSFGHETLEGKIDAETKLKQAALIERLRELDKNIDPFNVWADRTKTKRKNPITGQEETVTFQDLVVEEIFDIAAAGDAKGNYLEVANRVTSGNKTANTLARAVYEAIILPTYYELNVKGKATNAFDYTPKIIYKMFKVKNLEIDSVDSAGNPIKLKGEEAFVKLVGDNLNGVHGDATARYAIARRIYEKLQVSNDWRQADSVIQEIKKQKLAENSDLDASTVPGTIKWASGRSFLEVNRQIGDALSLQEILQRSINESGRVLGLTKFFGPNFERGYEMLVEAVEKGTELGNSSTKKIGGIDTIDFTAGSTADKKFAISAKDYTTHLINPWISENMNQNFMSTILSTVRNFEVVKLGGAIISNIGDLASFYTVARGRLGTGRLATIRALTGYAFSGNKQELKEYATGFTDFAEIFIGAHQDRFRMMDHSGVSAKTWLGDKIIKGSAWTAHKTLQWSGFNLWNRSVAMAATGLVTREIGDMISNAKRTWKSLSDIQRYNFEKFGFGETEFNLLKQSKALDSSGRFNMYAWKRFVDNQPKDIIGGNDMVTKMINVVNDITESMVIKPGAIDRAAIGFFNKPGSVIEQVMRAITQFQTFMVSHSRKVLMFNFKNIIGKQWARGEYFQAAASLAQLYAPMFILGVAALQLKQFVAGKDFYNRKEASIRSVYYTNFFPFIGNLYWQNGGAEMMRYLISDNDENFTKRGITMGSFMRDLLGPTLTDFESFVTNTAGIGKSGLMALNGDEYDAKRIFRQSVSRLTRTFEGLDPLANMFYTKAIWRSIFYDSLLEYYDPITYNRYKRRLENRASNERMSGELYNFIGRALNE